MLNTDNHTARNISKQVDSELFIPHTWWGKAWQNNLVSYSQEHSALGYSITMLQSITIITISIDQLRQGHILARVQPTQQKPLDIVLRIKPLSPLRQQTLINLCRNKIADLQTLWAGRLSPELEEILTNRTIALFPAPADIAGACSCAKWSDICQHTTAVLYAISGRLDADPSLLFKLRGIDPFELFNNVRTSPSGYIDTALQTSTRVLDHEQAQQLFKL